MRAFEVVLAGVILSLGVAVPARAQWVHEATPAGWQEVQYPAGPVKSEILAAGDDGTWSLSAQKLESAVPADEYPDWDWKTLYVNGELSLMGLGGLTDTVTGLELQNLNSNDAMGLPARFELSGSGMLKYGSAFELLGQFDAAESGPPTYDMATNTASGRLTYAELTVYPIDVTIDIKPGSDPNALNLGANGVLPVALLGSDLFDVTIVDPALLLLESVAPRARGRSGKMASYEDVNADGFMDMMLHFNIPDLVNLDASATEATLLGLLDDGEVFMGTDSLKIVGGGKYRLRPVPEPATLSLLALGAVALLRRRRPV